MTSLLLLRHATRPFESLASLGGEHIEAAGARLLAEEARCAVLSMPLKAALHAAAGPRIEAQDEAASRRRVAILALGRSIHNERDWREADLEAAAPALPPAVIASLADYREALIVRAKAAAAWEEAFAAGLAAGRRAVVASVRDPLVCFGIALASRPLMTKIAALDARDPGTWKHGDRHVAAKAAAYLARFATKTSPHSVFCATALARAAGDRLMIAGGAAIEHTEVILNVAEARKVACVLAADPACGAALVPRPNPTLREESGAWSFWRFASMRSVNDDESLSRVKEHPVLRAVLEESAAHLCVSELLQRVAARCELAVEELAPFLRQMIDSGILIGELEIPYNERRPLRFVAARVRDTGCDAPWIEPALAVERSVDALATGGNPDPIRAMTSIEAALMALPHARSIVGDELFRLDAASGLNVTLPESVVFELQAGLRPYTRLFATLYPARRYLQGWVDRFLAKFPADQDVELLDVYRAVTEQNDSYRPTAFPDPSQGETPEADRAAKAMNAVRDYLATAAAGAAPGEAIVFDDAVLDRLVPGAPDPGWACGVLFQIAARATEAIAWGEHRFVLNGIFHGAGLSLSRFAHLLGGERNDDTNPIVRELRRAWSVLERPNVIVAELTYNHLGRTANAGLRPAIFDHEIELPGDCASPGARVYGLRDLVVRFDSASDRFILRLATGGTEVLPVINSGVNPVGFVSFLVAIGEQSLQPIGYFPGFDAPGVTHWPAVVAGRLILFRERWIFRRGEWPEPPLRGDELTPFARGILTWRDRWQLPRHVFVHSSKEPKPRYVDLGSPVFLDLLRRDLVALSAETGAELHVSAMCPGPDELLVHGEDGGYATEFLVQMSGGRIRSPR